MTKISENDFVQIRQAEANVASLLVKKNQAIDAHGQACCNLRDVVASAFGVSPGAIVKRKEAEFCVTNAFAVNANGQWSVYLRGRAILSRGKLSEREKNIGIIREYNGDVEIVKPCDGTSNTAAEVEG